MRELAYQTGTLQMSRMARNNLRFHREMGTLSRTLGNQPEPNASRNWPKEEREATEIKTRKLPTMHQGFHPKSCTLKLYKN